jgi:hypothetical protein
VSLGGNDAGEFAVVSQPTPDIAAHGSAALVVAFRPASPTAIHAPPGRSATLSIQAVGSSNSPFVISLAATAGFYDCLTGAASEIHDQCNTCLFDLSPAVRQYVADYVVPTIGPLIGLPTTLEAIREIILQRHPLWLLGIDMGSLQSGSQHFVQELLYRLEVLARSQSVPKSRADQLLAVALDDVTALDLLSGMNNLAALDGLSYTMQDFVAQYAFYDVTLPLYDKFAFMAQDIIKYRTATGCSSFAAAYVAIVKELGLFPNPADVRYMVTTRSVDYNKACAINNPRDTNIPMSGHQVVLVRIAGTWYVVNETGVDQNLVPMPPSFDPDAVGTGPTPYENILLTFPTELGPTTHVIRKISPDANTSICDNTYENLMNISASGQYTSNICLWEDVDE